MRASDRFVREEVQRQGFDLDTPRGIARFHWMQSAWAWAKNKAEVAWRPSVKDILLLGCAVEPLENPQGFRKVPVMVRGNRTVGWMDVPNALRKLWKYGKDLTAEQFYYEFEMIHPFTDGNGRVGAILYNWLRGTWRKPEAPPDVFLGYESGWRRLLIDATLPDYKESPTGRIATGPELQNIPEQKGWRQAFIKWALNHPIQGADEGKHTCSMLGCRKCHNCGSEGGQIHGPWNLCDGCDQERAYNDADDAEYEEALLRAECDDDEVGYVAEPEDDWDEDERG